TILGACALADALGHRNAASPDLAAGRAPLARRLSGARSSNVRGWRPAHGDFAIFYISWMYSITKSGRSPRIDWRRIRQPRYFAIFYISWMYSIAKSRRQPGRGSSGRFWGCLAGRPRSEPQLAGGRGCGAPARVPGLAAGAPRAGSRPTPAAL